MDSTITILTAWSILLLVGLMLSVLKRKHKVLLSPGIALILISMSAHFVLAEVYLWQFDRLRGWNLRLSVLMAPYHVTLVQEPGFDFYESYFEIRREDGRIAKVLIDADDRRWWHPDAVERDGKTYFVRDSGEIN
jgi:hypothetical protein